jgi:hypothetical protein
VTDREPSDDDLRPYLELAREIQSEIARTAEDPRAGGDELVAAIEAVPGRERQRVLLAAFGRLPAERQWEIIEAAFGDAEIREHLAAVHAEALAIARRDERHRAQAATARLAGRLDLEDLPSEEEVVVGLFRRADVRGAIVLGIRSTVCARQLVLRTTPEPGRLRVIDDTFNPRNGMFVTAEYDHAAWERDHLTGHALVRLGSLTPTDDGMAFDPRVYAGARVDFEVGDDRREGILHLGFVTLGGEDVFATPTRPSAPYAGPR